MNTDRAPFQVAAFMLGGQSYRHLIYSQERDQVELTDERGTILLEFSSSLSVVSQDGKVGDIHLQTHHEEQAWVYYENPLRTRIVFPTSRYNLFEVEVEISKRFLSNQASKRYPKLQEELPA